MHFSLFHLDFLYIAVTWVLLRWHQLFSLFMDPKGGLTWALSVVMLVVTARLLLFRMFIKQVHFQRRMQEMAPKFNEIKKKYKDDRAAQQRETMALQREEGFNPLAGCLPMFLQIPVFLGLYHVLRHLADSANAADRVNKTTGAAASARDLHQLTMYGFSQNETISAAKAKLFGAPLAGSFRDGATALAKLGGDVTSTRLVILPLLLISALATFATQLLARANQTVAPTGSNAALQKIFLWVFPLGVLASGLIFNFPLGVLLYWFTSNTWTLAQQAYIIRFHPPATPAASVSTTTAKAVAPRPGQKPVYDRTRANKRTPSPGIDGAPDATPSTPVDEIVEPSPAANNANGSDVVPPSVPRPQRSGQRTSRPGTNRPAAKRPSRAKKRR
jgi:YidC/Oxa1 family membrane protein insertase